MKSFDLGKIKNVFGTLRKMAERDPSKLSLHPYRDWAILVGMFFASVAGFGLLGAYQYYTVTHSTVTMITAVPSAHDATLDEQGIIQTLDYYQSKSDRLDALMISRTQVPDPSL